MAQGMAARSVLKLALEDVFRIRVETQQSSPHSPKGLDSG